MGILSFPVILGLLMVSAAASLIVLWLIDLNDRIRTSKRADPKPLDRSNSFLFHENELIHHDVGPLPGYLFSVEKLTSWQDLRNWLGDRFGELPSSLSDLPTDAIQRFESQGLGAKFELRIHRSGLSTRAILHDITTPSPAEWISALVAAEQTNDAQDILDHSPFPIWKTDAADKVVWKNAPCDEIEQQLGKLPEIDLSAQTDKTGARFSVPHAGDAQPSWFEVTSHDLGRQRTLHFATGIDQVVRAESAQRDFVQTLTKTFASLTTGLAVFDKNRQLALFNPALVDLTGVSATFLSARPDVIRFFDELRERQVLPEPKNYASLRARIRDVIAKAHEGSYLETWNLPAGVTYRVTGRPHPDGAVAFLFEDISLEIMKTRQFRTQIELGQAVMDGLEEAIIVIAPNNYIMLCNSAACALINLDCDCRFTDLTVNDLIDACRDQFNSDSLWVLFESALRDGGTPSNNSSDKYLSSRTGGRFQYQIRTLPGGVRMVSFEKVKETAKSLSMSAAE